jgi:RHS repeat-associated protein
VGNTIRWYVYDGLGSVLADVDPNGNVTASRKYDVYGGVRSSTGTSTSKHKFVGKLGHPSDDESSLIYMQARYMDPQTGRFISLDPAEYGRNWFAYAHSNPVCRVDATGTIDGVLAGEEMEVDWASAVLAAGFAMLVILVGAVMLHDVALDVEGGLVSEMRRSREEDKWHRGAKQTGMEEFRRALKDWLENGQQGPKPRPNYPQSWNQAQRDALQAGDVDGSGDDDGSDGAADGE